MVSSMTAFARQESSGEWGSLVWEVRSINHRYLEVSVRMPEELRALEIKVREAAQKALARGKVDCTLRYRPAEGGGGAVTLNVEHARQLLTIADEVGSMMEASAAISPTEIMRFPGVVKEAEADMSALNQATMDCLAEALSGLVDGRQREGERLKGVIEQRMQAIEPLVARARERIPQVLIEVRERLQAKLDEISGEMEPTRLEQEMVMLAQRLDVDEELDRLGSHLQELKHTLERNEPIGRRLDFLMQEFNREANTLASKSNDSEMTKIGVDLKVLIEQMREQVQNIE